MGGAWCGVVVQKDSLTTHDNQFNPLPSHRAREQKIATLVADSNDAAALNALAKRTKVVVTTVGPYAKVCSELGAFGMVL